MLLDAVGLITDAMQAKDTVEESEHEELMADAIFVARQFVRGPKWVWGFAWKLGVDVAWPSKFRRVRFLE